MAGFSTFSLAPYSGEWNIKQAAHLLRRTMYGPTQADIDQAVDQGLDETIQVLFKITELPDPPLVFRAEADTVPLGETWVNQPYDRAVDNQVGSRLASLRAWNSGVLLNQGMSIREKMVLFWRNHFVTSDIRDATYVYQNLTLYRENFLGNFRQLAKDSTVNPAMLRYLNGSQNTNFRPNENYARELLELFTIGKGLQVGEGDYTNYTEQDVAEVARVLTGWRDIGYFQRGEGMVQPFFRSFAHDTGEKQLSHRFGNATIQNMGDQEYSHLIDLIFQQDEVSRFITRKIYRWFVYYEIDEQIELEIIEPLSQILRDADYEMGTMVETLLRSEHFHDNYAIGAMIKNPIDFVIGQFREFSVDLENDDHQLQYRLWLQLARLPQPLEMSYFDPPSVAGWKAYYQEPLYYRTWINSSTLSFRYLMNQIVINGVQVRDHEIKARVLEMIETIEEAEDPNKLIESLAQYLLPHGVTEQQRDDLKAVLIPGLPDYEWGVEYQEYLFNPEDEELKAGVENRLQALLTSFVSLPEYQLS